MLDEVVAVFDGHHELGAEQAADANQGLHAGDEVGEGAVVICTVVPGAARPDGITMRLRGFGLKEILLYDLDLVVELLEFEPVDQPHRVGVGVTRKLDLTPVESEGVSFDGDDAVAGGGEWEHELAVTRADDGDRGIRRDVLLQRGEELREEREGVLPQAPGLHGVLLSCRWR